MNIRIQKYLSEKGITSRRNAESWIASGFISVNGTVVTEPGTRIDPDKDTVTIAPEALKEELHYYLFNKPKGIVTVNPHPGEQAIGDIVELPNSVVPVGRLDKDSSGLILLTNDGVVARRIMDPAFEHEKEYEVLFHTKITDEALEQISQGMVILGERTRPVLVTRLGPARARMVLTEGKNRQIRRMCDKVGFPVKELKRVRLLSFHDTGLIPGKLKELKPDEVQELYRTLELTFRTNMLSA